MLERRVIARTRSEKDGMILSLWLGPAHEEVQ
jgi:hypothetical protein